MTEKTVGALLSRLGGANAEVLAKVPAAKGGFIQMGLVLLSTAGLAVVSMSFALVDGLKAPVWVAIPLGLGWGFVIINLDRMLIQNMRVGSGVWRAVGMIAPRLLVAGLLGIVIATPLVLRIFHDEILANMREENARSVAQLAADRKNGPEAKRLEEVNAKIATNEGVLAGNVPGITSPNVEAARTQLREAETTLTAKRDAAAKAYDAMRCELDGERCAGGSGKRGPGPRYEALKRLYGIAARDLERAEAAVRTAQNALDKANKEAAAGNTEKVEEAQTQARAELPGLRQERDKLQAGINGVTAVDSDIQINNTGILAQIEALGRIGEESPSAERAHLAVALLLFMIELLPVLVKLLTILGPPSVYDRISELDSNSTLDKATEERNTQRRTIEADSKKRRKIEDDMRNREVALGIQANKHVADQMEQILDVALEQWSRDVTRTLHTSQAAAAATPSGPKVPNQPGAPSTNGVRTAYNLPPQGAL